MKNKEEFLDSVYQKYEERSKEEKITVVRKNKTFKKVATVAACLVLCVGLASTTGMFNVGKSSDMATTESFAYNDSMAYDTDFAEKNSSYGEFEVAEESESYALESASAGSADGGFSEQYDGTVSNKENLKLIYTASVSVETTDFEKTVEDIKAVVNKYEGYFESQQINNGGYYESSSYKSGYYTIRIPQEKYREFLDGIGNDYHVSYLNENIEDVGQAYYEVESHIKTLKIKEQRLQDLLKKATDLSDIIELESALSDNEYQLEMYQNELNNYDSLVNYSTIHLDITKVTQFSEGVTLEKNFFGRLWNSFKNGSINFLEGIGDFFVWLGYNIFTIILIFAILFLVIRVDIFGKIFGFFKGAFRKGKKKKEEK